jgi:hypothetical protein
LPGASAKFLGRRANAVDGAEDVFHELICMPGTTVGEFPLDLRPDSFVGIQFQCTSGKAFDAQAAMLALELLDGASLVGGGIMQQRNERAVQLTWEFTQEPADLFLPDVLV